MEQHYREHVIAYDTSYDHKSKEWMGVAQVRFSEGVKVRIVSCPYQLRTFRPRQKQSRAAF